ncbi:minor tail protein [Gordonia phage Stormageddon]|uniref:Minor tail protein n=1 Tax=Gordonia phage Stormageddon TaxID=2656541 RepID=A0A649VRN3_9CAUD|nr:minor tail protein [Gordonia phage Stormageddon]QGJ94911.1 minor tail protein [Gordonia phage Stormageddon]
MAFPPLDPRARPTRAMVAITDINLDTNSYSGYNPQMGTLSVRASMQPGGHISIPAVGEQWLVENLAGQWVLVSKTDWLDERVTAIPNQEGMDVIGSMNGPTYITGSRVELPQTVWLSGVELRVHPDTHMLQYRSGETWVNMVADSGPSGSVPTRVAFIQTLGVRALGTGQVPEGVRPGPCTLTEVTYEFGTADSGSSTVVELRKNGTMLAGSQLTVSAANQAIGAGTEAARTATGTWSFAKGDVLTVNITSIGTGPGQRLTAHLYGTTGLS